MTLTAISAGFTDNAEGVQDSWDSIGSALSGIPFVGDDLQGAVTGLSDATVGNAVQAGRGDHRGRHDGRQRPGVRDVRRPGRRPARALPAAAAGPLTGVDGRGHRALGDRGEPCLRPGRVERRRPCRVPASAPIPEIEGQPHDTIALPWGPDARPGRPAPGPGPARSGGCRVPARRAAGPACPVRPAVRRPRALHPAAVRGVLRRGLRPADPGALRPRGARATGVRRVGRSCRAHGRGRIPDGIVATTSTVCPC